MINRKNLNRLALAFAAIVICFVLAVGAAAALAPAEASPEALSDNVEMYGGQAGYFPAQLVGREGELEVLQDLFD